MLVMRSNRKFEMTLRRLSNYVRGLTDIFQAEMITIIILTLILKDNNYLTSHKKISDVW